MEPHIEEIGDHITAEEARDIHQLYTQLTDHAPDIRQVILNFMGLNLLSQMKTVVVVARADQRIVGMATLIHVRTLKETKGLIEDVVVNTEFRGHHTGEKLMTFLIDYARKMYLDRIELTSKPSRTAANALYQKLGFKKRETNAYCLTLT